MPSKPIELPPEVAKAFVRDMHFKDLRVTNATGVGILNKDSRDLSFERTEVDMDAVTVIVHLIATCMTSSGAPVN
jgi:hypothetical protein